MNSNDFVKLIALSIVGGVAKALFAPRVSSAPSTAVYNAAYKAADKAVDKVADAGLKAVTGEL